MTNIGKITRNAHKQRALSPKKEVIKLIYFSLKSTNFQMVDKTFIENLEGEIWMRDGKQDSEICYALS